MYIKILPKDQRNIVNEYQNKLTSMIELAKKYNVTRQTIHKILKRHEVDTTNRQITVSCKVCGTLVKRHKSRIRKQLNHFCTHACWIAFLQAGHPGTGPYTLNRHAMRQARKKVERYYDLQPDHIVHHEDRDTNNNSLYNLKVFACPGDHVRYHRGFDVNPLWDGAKEKKLDW